MPFSVTWTPILGSGLSFNQEFMNWTYWLAQEPQKSYLCSSTLSAMVTDMYLKLASHGCQDMNWGPHACTAGPVTELSP